MPQTAFMFDDTVRGNVTLGADVPDDEVWAALRTAQADGFVAALPDGLDTKLGERGTSLSGGQRQRLSLARALVRRPRLLILDDATSAVDPEVEARILASLRDDRDDRHAASLVVVAYRKATISLADEVLHLDDGPDRRPRHPRRAARPQPGLRPASSTPTRPTPRSMPTRDPPPTEGAEHERCRTHLRDPDGHRRGHRCHGDPPPRHASTRPSCARGSALTLFYAVIASCGQIVVPIAVQQTLDRGLNGSGRSAPRLRRLDGSARPRSRSP